MPLFEDPYHETHERRRCAESLGLSQMISMQALRLTTLYQLLHDAIHARSGQAEPLKLQYIRTEKESVMGWVSSFLHLLIDRAGCKI